MTYRAFNVAIAVFGATTGWLWYLYTLSKDNTVMTFACALTGALISLCAMAQVYCKDKPS